MGYYIVALFLVKVMNKIFHIYPKNGLNHKMLGLVEKKYDSLFSEGSL